MCVYSCFLCPLLDIQYDNKKKKHTVVTEYCFVCACTIQYICTISVTVNLSCIKDVHNDLHYANNDVDVNLNLLVCGDFPVLAFDQCYIMESFIFLLLCCVIFAVNVAKG